MTGLGEKKHDRTGRSIGARKTNKRTAIGGQFAPRLIDMLRSPAYRVLTQSEHRCLARIEIELADHGGADNGKLPCTYDDFEHYGIHRHAIAPALRALAALGFIEVTEKGRAGNAEWRRPTLFRLTYRNTARAAPTDEWRCIETMADANSIASAVRRAPKKQNPSGGKRTIGQCGNRTTKGIIHSAETATTCVSADSATTVDILGGVGGLEADLRRFAVVLPNGALRRVGVRSSILSNSERAAGAGGAE